MKSRDGAKLRPTLCADTIVVVGGNLPNPPLLHQMVEVFQEP